VADRTGVPAAPLFQCVYRATADGFGAGNFHDHCDGVRRLLVVIRTVSGFLFGGFGSKAFTPHEQFVADATAFVYSLVNPHELPPVVCPVRATDVEHALCNGQDFGPRYGLNAIVICHNSNRVPESETYFPHSFVDPTGLGRELFVGGRDLGYIDEILAFAA